MKIMNVKKFWCGLDENTVGTYIGYASATLSALISFFLILILKDNIILIFRSDAIGDFFIFLAIICLFIFATISSVGLVYGIEKRISKYIFQYLIFVRIVAVSIIIGLIILVATSYGFSIIIMLTVMMIISGEFFNL